MRYHKHQEHRDVQIHIRLRDAYGNEIAGAIEYDPDSGWGKRIVDAERGLTDEFYYPGGSVEVQGHINPDEHKFNAIKMLITGRVSKTTDPAHYNTMLEHFTNESIRQKAKPVITGTEAEPLKRQGEYNENV